MRLETVRDAAEAIARGRVERVSRAAAADAARTGGAGAAPAGWGAGARVAPLAGTAAGTAAARKTGIALSARCRRPWAGAAVGRSAAGAATAAGASASSGATRTASTGARAARPAAARTAASVAASPPRRAALSPGSNGTVRTSRRVPVSTGVTSGAAGSGIHGPAATGTGKGCQDRCQADETESPSRANHLDHASPWHQMGRAQYQHPPATPLSKQRPPWPVGQDPLTMSRHAHPVQPSGSLVTQCPPTGVPHELMPT